MDSTLEEVCVGRGRVEGQVAERGGGYSLAGVIVITLKPIETRQLKGEDGKSNVMALDP